MFKKILSVVLALCMLLTMFTVSSVMAENETDIVTKVAVSEEGDGSITISFASKTTNVGAFGVKIPYGTEKFTISTSTNSKAKAFNKSLAGTTTFNNKNGVLTLGWNGEYGMQDADDENVGTEEGAMIAPNADGLYEIAVVTFDVNKAALSDADYETPVTFAFEGYTYAVLDETYAPTELVPSKTEVSFNIPDTRTEIEGLTATPAEGLKYTGEAFAAKDLITVNALETTDTVEYVADPAEVKNAGTYKVTATVKRAGYKPTEVSADVTIGKADTTITIADDAITYGETEYTKDFTVAEGVDKAEITVSDYAVADLNAGEKEITATATSANYNVTVTPGILTVAKKAITAAVKKATKVYGEADPAFEAEATGLVGSDELTYTFDRAEGENVGKYAITATAANDNYTVDVTAGELEITKKPLTIKVQDEFQVLGNGKLTTFKDPVFEGLVGEDTIEITEYVVEDWADAEADYVLTVKYTDNANYKIDVVSGKYSVKSAIPVNVKFGENKKTYGDADKAEFVAEGDLDKVTITRVKGLDKADAGEYKDAYEVTLKELEDASGLPYALNVENNVFVIEPKAATITINAAEKFVEDADPEYTFTAADFLEGEEPAEINFVREENEKAGDYAVTTDYKDDNYKIAVVAGKLTIKKYAAKPVFATNNELELEVEETAPADLKALVKLENVKEADLAKFVIAVAKLEKQLEDGTYEAAASIDTSAEASYKAELTVSFADAAYKYDIDGAVDNVATINATIVVEAISGRPSGAGSVIRPATGGATGGTTTKPEDDKKDDETSKPAASANIALKEDAKELKFIEGFEDKTFRPDTNATRNDVVAALTALFDVTDVQNAPTFGDTDDAAIKALAAAGVINGYEDGTFKGYNDVTRAEFVKLVAAALKLEAVEGATANFSDIDGHWAAEWIKTFAGKGYLVGYPDGTFRPDDKITRAEMVVVMTRVVGTVDAETAVNFADVDDAHWAYDYIMKAAK